MSKLVIICTVCLLTIVSQSNSLSNSDIKEILDVLRTNKADSTSSDSDSLDDESSDDELPDTKYMRTDDVIDLIKKYNDKKENSRVQNNNQYGLPYYEKRKERYESDVLNNLLAHHNNKKRPHLDGFKRHLFHQLIKNEQRKKQKKSLQPSAPNRLLTPVSLKDEDERGQMDGLDEYSKLFVVLDPLALQKNENKNELKSLLLKIFSEFSATNEKSRQERNKDHLYKGFKVKDNFLSRRYRQNSKENNFAPNSMSDEVIIKRRPKNDYGGGGGGSTGGRTAIPYVKLRGDIYERDH